MMKDKDKIIVKKEEETDPSYGSDPNDRDIINHIRNGFINLDKIAGPTSHQVTYYVKKILNIDKAGHAGTLDPAVTGILPIALENSCKVLKALLLCGKEYVCLMHVHKDKDAEEIKKVMQSFVGKIKQVPPVRSHVKRVLREREIYYINILEIKDRDVLFRVGCESGTYIRKLCDQIGKKLGTGAHMVELRRTKVGQFNEDYHLVKLEDLQLAYYLWRKECDEKFLRYCILPCEFAVEHLKKIWISDNAVDPICTGAQLAIPGVVKFNNEIKRNELIAIMTLKDELVAIARSNMTSEEIQKNKKGIVCSLERVIMKKGTYPSLKK
ncbi:MAG: RNA-guided pseudouridylation complex pseudouridine synthase subunit Cbf5 [Candidatus Parvarchaeota archaeon]|nr:RNA-guided pseudouridylation complex pseudouridine synthase subunit Cbf5 [Candidatus Jingweiarchaeum tengchongense]MCW1297778.1 RNA-guided pseudouridylation complex pseudouridine synthase subunit Cbf5 [Candidatus Jingweiarchaeum tengchongense]MCW1299788.1 RNA-guided pseudouridylation complex pseudouridine synthase subunit Cbf5 [Candidatus Jingweiarchaeum tengchongense]MCW1304241.1 RNA-guided pseudouridylation complex pseudouridine synthase subunit Cbf5 [Candidatus Jingweiarchaeum tengchongens